MTARGESAGGAGRAGQAGLSLPEVLVYVAVSGIVIGILTLALRNVNEGFVTGTRTVKLQQDAREAVSIMNREIRNTGLKRAHWIDGGGKPADSLLAEAALSAADSSSFLPTDGGRYDALVFRQARLASDGRPQGVDTVTYRVDPGRNMLTRRLNDGRDEDFCPNVDAMQFQYGVYAEGTPFQVSRPPTAAAWTSAGSAALAFTATRMALSLPAGGAGAARCNGTSFDIDAAATYVLEIAVAADEAFLANGGALSAQIVGPGGAVMAEERFRPSRALLRHRVEFTAPSSAGCHLSLGITASGPAAVKVAYVRFGPADRGRYSWLDAPDAALRKNVRAVRILLMAKAGGPGSGVPRGSYAIGNTTVAILDTEPRRYFEEEVPIPNNGVF